MYNIKTGDFKKVTNILKNFWVLEGLDGSGTTTQLKMINNELTKKGIPFHITQEPTTNETGLFLRRVLKGEIQVSQSTIAHLFAADRDDHIYNAKYGILSHLNNREIVISDRYMFSSLAYQSLGYDYDKIMSLNQDFPYPEYIIFVDTPVEECIKRINARGEQKEIFEKLEIQKKVLEGYEKCFRNLPLGCNLLRVNGMQKPDKVFSDIMSVIFNEENE